MPFRNTNGWRRVPDDGRSAVDPQAGRHTFRYYSGTNNQGDGDDHSNEYRPYAGSAAHPRCGEPVRVRAGSPRRNARRPAAAHLRRSQYADLRRRPDCLQHTRQRRRLPRLCQSVRADFVPGQGRPGRMVAVQPHLRRLADQLRLRFGRGILPRRTRRHGCGDRKLQCPAWVGMGRTDLSQFHGDVDRRPAAAVSLPRDL